MNTEKLDAVVAKMNRITQELHKNVEVSEDILTSTEELANYLSGSETKTELVPVSEAVSHLSESKTLAPITEIAADVVNVSHMIDDFQFMRGTLRETTRNAKRVLESVTEELLLSEGDQRANLIVAYSELNKTQIESVKLFMLSYREISTILVNLSKVHNAGTPHTVHTTNVLNIEDKSHISSADIINRLRGAKGGDE